MPKKLKPTVDFHQRHFMQISESHCGPAVVQMLLSNLGVEVTQNEIAKNGGATKLIKIDGMRVDQLARAVQRLAPHLYFYYKDHATIEELARVVNDYRHPAGVEWQGVFEDEDTQQGGETKLGMSEQKGLLADSESEDEDFGHYSVVVRIDRRKHQLIIADPYKDYFSQARVFGFQEFDQRWYDFNEVFDPVSKKAVLVEDDHLFFVIVRGNTSFPRRMGMRTFSS